MKGGLDEEFLPAADDGGVALVLDDDAEFLEGARDEVEVVRQGMADLDLAASDGAEGEEGDDLVVVGVDGERAALEALDALNGELARAEAGNLRAHADEDGAQVLHVGLAGGVDDDGRALSEGGGHDEVFRRGHRHVVGPVPRAAKAVLERERERVVVGNFRAEFFQDLEVRIEFADAERAAFGVRRDGDLLHPIEQWRKQQDGRTHARRQLAIEVRGIEGRVVEQHGARGLVPGDARTLLGEKRDELVDVRDRRDVEQADGRVGQERGAEDGQGGILVARRRDGAGEGLAASDDEIGHEG